MSECNRVSAALDGAARRPRVHRTLFEAQLWLLGVFVAMSLLAGAANTVISGTESPAVSAVLAIAGVALFPVAWRNVASLLERADDTPRSEAACAAKVQNGASARKLQLALQR